MPVFGAYSRYYDLLYRDKNSAEEAEYLAALISKHDPGAKSLLDFGCGTGRRDLLLADLGFEAAGVDRSEEMLAVADARRPTCDPSRPFPTFHQGDLRALRLDRTFDVVTALFRVMSYQAGNQDLRAALATARAHLAPGGLFIFDCWYGPAVLTDRPAVRVKRLEDDALSITRIAEPVMHPNENLVDVRYVFVRDKASGALEELRETHRMRYLFKLELMLAEAGFSLVEAADWLTGRPAGFDTWGACFVVQG